METILNSIHDQHQLVKNDRSISTGLAYTIAVGFIPIAAVIVLLPYWLIWRSNSFSFTIRLGLVDLLPLVSVGVLSIAAHEAIHGLGAVWFGRVPRSALHFGIQRRTLTPYTNCLVPVSASAYRKAIALPGLVLGALPAALGIILGIGWLSLYGLLMMVAAGGDLAILWAIRKVSAEALVMDHPERAGCWELAAEPD